MFNQGHTIDTGLMQQPWAWPHLHARLATERDDVIRRNERTWGLMRHEEIARDSSELGRARQAPLEFASRETCRLERDDAHRVQRVLLVGGGIVCVLSRCGQHRNCALRGYLTRFRNDADLVQRVKLVGNCARLVYVETQKMRSRGHLTRFRWRNVRYFFTQKMTCTAMRNNGMHATC
jgi:hypothetical protein